MNNKAISNNELKRRFDTIRDGDDFTDPVEPTPHREILANLKNKVGHVNFRETAGIEEGKKVKSKHFLVITIKRLLKLASENNWGLCRRNSFIYLFNGAYWDVFDENEFESFLGECAEIMGVDEFSSSHFRFRDDLLKQFKSFAYLPAPERDDNTVLINTKNCTVEINPTSAEVVKRREPCKEDFMTYQLPFPYQPDADAPLFFKYLNKVLPKKELQQILAEYIGYVFVRQSTLKLEKALILYGSGANGKSVFFYIINALLGRQNVSTYTLQSITEDKGYYRAKLQNKLVNYASEINGRMQTSLFKQMVSGEPVEARPPYKEPFIMKDYAKLIFNCNELPTDVEHTHAFFRRFMIIPFEVTIPEEKQDKQLSKKIKESELSGVFNWVMDGLKRVLKNKDFTQSDEVEQQRKVFHRESDSVQMFIGERGYSESMVSWTLLKELYAKYKSYCDADGYYPVAKRKFSKRLEKAGYKKIKKSAGMSFHITDD
jgi:putative DNA primase/helicase